MVPALYSAVFLVRPAVELVQKGRLPDCPAPEARCSCETSLYATVGVLAFLGGTIQFAFGYYRSMAVLSDSLHALADAGADFWGMYIARAVHLRRSDEHTLRAFGNKVIALLLMIGALLVGYEAIGRWREGTYLVSPPVILVAGACGLVIDLIRWRTLDKVLDHSCNENLLALIEHARSDALHSALIMIVGMIATMGAVLPFDESAYHRGVRVVDFAASIALVGYMMYLSGKIWRGRLCSDRRAHGDDREHHH